MIFLIKLVVFSISNAITVLIGFSIMVTFVLFRESGCKVFLGFNFFPFPCFIFAA